MEHPENSAEYKGLTVNSGVAQPSIVNPYLKRGRYRHRQMSAGDYVEGILKGDVTVLGRAVTLVESTNPAHQAVAQEVIEKCLPHAGRSIRVSVTAKISAISRIKSTPLVLISSSLPRKGDT